MLRLSLTVDCSPTSDLRPPIFDLRSPISDLRPPTSDLRPLPFDLRKTPDLAAQGLKCSSGDGLSNADNQPGKCHLD